MTHDNPLLTGIEHARIRIAAYRDHAKRFYLEVLFTTHHCPACGGRLAPLKPDKAHCLQCRTELDPTVAFQKSSCCNATLVRRRRHYACSRCHETMPSKFLFEERNFDSVYFRQKMAESRERGRFRREELRKLLRNARSPALQPDVQLSLDAVPGLLQDLEAFIGSEEALTWESYREEELFRMEAYREAILNSIGDWLIHFDALQDLHPDPRIERTRRFTTLVFMEHAREVWLEQRDESILVMPYEAHE